MTTSKSNKIAKVASMVALAAMCLLMASCKTQTVVVERVQHDSIYVQNVKQDSIYIHDSVMVDRGRDTITIYKYHTDYRYQFVHDTTSIMRVDSIPYPVEVVREVRKPNGWDRFCHWATIGLFVAMLLFLAYKLIKLYMRR